MSEEALFPIYLQPESLSQNNYTTYTFMHARDNWMWYWSLHHTVYGIAINYKLQSFGSVTAHTASLKSSSYLQLLA